MAGIYIHIPFCRKACNYCNFHFSTTRHQENDFIEALLKEIILQKDYLQALPVSSLYFGGGTPSLLDSRSLQRILDTVRQHFSINDHAEITLEANPDDITREQVRMWRQQGINRLSVGVQSFADADLQWMNRAHTATQALNGLEMAMASFTQLSIDLIYGTPTLTDSQWAANLEIALKLGIPHLSCYALTVEQKTSLDHQIKTGTREPVNPEDQARQFQYLMERLGQAGYEHYEISNFALPGHRSRHNSSYWLGTPYLGLGPSAHSFNGHSRQWNLANNALYIQSLKTNQLPFEMEILQPVQQVNEYIMTALRTSEGLRLDQVGTRFGTITAATLQARISKWEERGHVIQQDSAICLTPSGKLYADGIAADLFFEQLPQAGS